MTAHVSKDYMYIRDKGLPWEQILARYEDKAADHPAWGPFRDLVLAISTAPYATLLQGVDGMDGLFLYGYAPFAYWHEMLLFTYDLWEGAHVFRYQETAGRKPCWQKRWVPDQSETIGHVFEHIITRRLKWIPQSLLTP
jgi:hypothetical protein